ncbi:MAG: shikimate kinase [bacterium]|nr:shikimate kinase [bacterium]
MAKRNLYLVGFMGTGKSTIGRELARVLGRKFVDIDQELEKRHGAAVSELFQQHGEAWFRQKEQELCAELAATHNRVVATGGGSLMNPANFEAFEKSGLLICLYTQRDCLVERLERNDKRPLLRNVDVPEKVDSLLKERQSIYDRIKIRIDTTSCAPLETAKKIADLLKTRQKILLKLRDQYIDLT